MNSSHASFLSSIVIICSCMYQWAQKLRSLYAVYVNVMICHVVFWSGVYRSAFVCAHLQAYSFRCVNTWLYLFVYIYIYVLSIYIRYIIRTYVYNIICLYIILHVYIYIYIYMMYFFVYVYVNIYGMLATWSNGFYNPKLAIVFQLATLCSTSGLLSCEYRRLPHWWVRGDPQGLR